MVSRGSGGSWARISRHYVNHSERPRPSLNINSWTIHSLRISNKLFINAVLTPTRVSLALASLIRAPAMVLARSARFEPLISSVLEQPGILGRLAELKLRREESSHEPSLRRCLGHHGVFRKCMTAAIQEDSSTQPRPFQADTHKTPPKRRHASETTPFRSQVAIAIKGMVHRNSSSVTLYGSSELSRVQAHESTKPPSMAPWSYIAMPKALLGHNPFARLKHKIHDKAVC